MPLFEKKMITFTFPSGVNKKRWLEAASDEARSKRSRSALAEVVNINKPRDAADVFALIEANDVVGLGRALLTQPSSVHTWRGDQQPLHSAVTRGACLDIVALLLMARAPVNALAGGQDYSPLHVAAVSGDHGLIDLLLRHGADPTAVLKSTGQLPFEIATCPTLRETLLDRWRLWKDLKDHRGAG